MELKISVVTQNNNSRLHTCESLDNAMFVVKQVIIVYIVFGLNKFHLERLIAEEEFL